MTKQISATAAIKVDTKAALITLSSHKAPTNLQLISKVRSLLKIKHLRHLSTKDLKAIDLQALGFSENKLTTSHLEEDASCICGFILYQKIIIRVPQVD